MRQDEEEFQPLEAGESVPEPAEKTAKLEEATEDGKGGEEDPFSVDTKGLDGEQPEL